jgi:hypothetical protein
LEKLNFLQKGRKIMRKTIFGSIIMAVAVTLVLSVSVLGQEITGSIVGTVRDSSGAVVPGATVTITDPSKNNVVIRTTVTNGEGEFSAPNLVVSTYDVAVEAPNFKKAITSGVKLDVGGRRTIDFALEAGKIDEVVTIEADTVGVDLTSAAVGTVIEGDQVRELSINNRNWTQLVALAPGVSNDLSDQVYVGTTNPDGQANTVQIAVNGARSSQNTFTVDGADITDRGSNLTIQAYPSVDSIGEFRVLRGLYPAEAGAGGGGQVNVVTRSGTSKFRGSAFVFARNDAFNANYFLINAQTNPQFGREENGKAKRAPLRYYNYGWTLGGPIYFLKFGERDPGDYFGRWSKTFFFFSQELRKDNRKSNPIGTTVPTDALESGIFPIDVCINRNNQPAETCTVGNPGFLAAGSTLNPAMWSPTARAYVDQIYRNIPGPNNATPANPFGAAFSLDNSFKFRQELFKLDHSFSDSLSGYYRYQRDKIPTIEGNSLFSSGSGLPDVSTTSSDSPGRTHTLQMTWAATPRLIFEGRYNHAYGAILSSNIGLLSRERTTIPIVLPYDNQRDRIPTLTGNGFTGFTSFGPYDNFSTKSAITGSVTWIAGSHTMKYGVMHSKYRKNENALAGFNEGRFTSFPSTLAPTVITSGTGANLPPGWTAAIAQNVQRWANFLVGNVAAGGFEQAKFDYTADFRQQNFEFFGQDEWRARPNLTLSAGVRYSFYGSPWDKNGRLTNFMPELWTAAQAPTVTGGGARVTTTGNLCNGIIANAQNFTTGPAIFNCRPTPSPFGKFVIDAKKNNWAPRVGLAWDPFGKGTTSVRTGYGIYYEQVLNGTLLQNIGTNPPYQETTTNSAVTRLDNPLGGVVGPPSVQGLRAIQTDFDTPYMQHWSLELQHQLDRNTFISVGYFGSKGTHLIGLTEFNSIAPGVALNSTCINNYSQSVPCQEPGYVFRNAGSNGANCVGTAGNTTHIPGNPNRNLTNCTQETTDILILDQIRPYKGFRSIAMVQPRYDSNYHSMQVSARRRFGGASQMQVAYTWAKNLTNSQNDRSTSPQDTYDIGSEMSRAALDRRHVFTLNYVYELPFFKDQKGFTGMLLGGWQASGIITLQTGLGFTATTSNWDPAGSGIINANPAARPDQLCDPNANAAHTRDQWVTDQCWFDTTFPITTDTRPWAANRFGSGQRNTIEGPGTRRVDFTMSKNMRFSERFSLQLRAEIFNIFNTTNYRGFVSTNITSGSFGVIGTTRDPRQMQFGAKLNF